MKIALATFPRDIGEMRVELDTEKRGLALVHYVPQLRGAPVCDKRFGIPAREAKEIAAAILEGNAQLIQLRMSGVGK